jgi:hypothetical protein
LAIDKQGNVGGYSVYSGFNYALKSANKEGMINTPYDRGWD